MHETVSNIIITAILGAIIVAGVAGVVMQISIDRQRHDMIDRLEMELREQQLLLEEFRIQAVRNGCMILNPETKELEWAQPTE